MVRKHLLMNASIFPPTVTDFTRDIKYIGSRTPGVEHSRMCVENILPFTSRVSNISENCLSLRIARPSGVQRDAKLPVAVWIHGGDHALGSVSDQLYTPDGLLRAAAAAGKPLIYVGINYRLMIFGLATSKAMIETKQTNAGLRDQRAASQWVQDRIEVSGGNPDRGIISRSVGASDIGLHLTSFNGSQDVLFQQAMMMSGAPGVNFNSDPVFVANNTVAIARQVGTSQLMRTGKFVKNIPIVASWVIDDGAWYASPQTATDEDVLGSFGLWLHGLFQSTKEKLLRLYPVEYFNHMVRPNYHSGMSPQYFLTAQMSRDIWFACPVLDLSWQYAQTGGSNASWTWLVAHLSDIPYVFNNLHFAGGADNSLDQMALSETVSKAIVHEGRPGGEGAGVQKWSSAYPTTRDGQRSRESASKLSIQLIGGPLGLLEVAIGRDGDIGVMTAAQQALAWERLFDRCDFINSP
ncbi:hypothetical protein ASPACDRAFT_55331 [Aspergillus aculeatus ATCC 16872]|uniref:Carboxylesterase type B domain-containing protein n=1 Tax=Aspergillus aculeatus (strain ATCC 16872 / CBS 172.66 / WB 5094) TaxID=690307 RepID=A0A1L9WGL3_ASPA1|nr:uncharacterized protein ASPACDRAFT_55331 [Aspergillus aculeatus ATCC 16872]OJJ95310.1 hypothetical protein ASPACDRAFT_55331 [Aspergillus aculeatus ATCC 16872]